MIPIPLDIMGLEVGYDPGANRWAIESAAGRHVLREWSWGERHRLIAACVRNGILDADAFVDGLFDLLITPRPPAMLRPLFTFVCLRLLGVPEDQRPPALAETERCLAERFGWRPGDLDHEPAGCLDRLSDHPGATASAKNRALPPGPGWTTILIEDTPAERANE